jgi:HAE1 family hydrophobic/amphiphilic exporter-1
VARLPGIVDTFTTLRMDKPELRVEIDRERAATLGVEVQEIAETLRIAVGGDERASRYHDNQINDTYDVELRLVGIDRGSRDAISQLYVRSKPELSGSSNTLPSLTRLDNVARFHYAETSPRIDHIDRQRMSAVRANLSPGFALADRIEAFRTAAKEMGLPPGYTTRVSGRGRELERTFQDFGWTFALSFIFMYPVLAGAVRASDPSADDPRLTAAGDSFRTGQPAVGRRNAQPVLGLGILVLFGVVKKTRFCRSITRINCQAAGSTALPPFCRPIDRLRPILMTTIAFVAGMLPLLIGTTAPEERRSIAVLAVRGQTLSLMLTLLATPVIYSLFDDLAQLLHRRRPQPTAERPPQPHVTARRPELVRLPGETAI